MFLSTPCLEAFTPQVEGEGWALASGRVEVPSIEAGEAEGGEGHDDAVGTRGESGLRRGE